ncbi:MAG: 30S ribosomal protein S16 [Parachlamydiaceae bacterium]|nr:30S ribosomal protein S16 [Parachlamydiaceae bacterium]
MALAIRLRQQGRRNNAVYRVVVMDVNSRRDGKYLEALGWYNPHETEVDQTLCIKADRIQHWISLGAQMTESVKNLVHTAAPSVVRAQTEQILARRNKDRAKRKARKAAAASA